MFQARSRPAKREVSNTGKEKPLTFFFVPCGAQVESKLCYLAEVYKFAACTQRDTSAGSQTSGHEHMCHHAIRRHTMVQQVTNQQDMLKTGEAITCNYVTMFVVLVSAGLKPADVHLICIFQRECFRVLQTIEITESAGFQTSGHELGSHPSILA